MIATEANTKQCSQCGKTKARSEFYRNRTKKNGYESQCKVCRATYQQSDSGKATYAKAQEKRKQSFPDRLRHCFKNIRRRCNNRECENYKDYGGRGIKCLITFDELYHHITITLGLDSIEKLKGLTVDRKNVNGNYEISNLRIATPSQQQMNCRKHQTYHGKKCSSRFKGVYWIKQRKKWAAKICIDGKDYHLGYFNDEIDAAIAYDEKAIELFGEFACTNQMLGLLN